MDTTPGLRAPAVTAIGLAAAALMAPLACIAQRHFGEWARLRAFVWQQVAGRSRRGFVP